MKIKNGIFILPLILFVAGCIGDEGLHRRDVTISSGSGIIDTDQDGIPDNIDNCPNFKNSDQVMPIDTNGDGVGVACEAVATPSEESAVVWTGVKQFGTSRGDFAKGIVVGQTGGFYVVGCTENEEGKSLALLASFSPSGEKKWETTLSPSSCFHDVSIDDNGDIYAAGFIQVDGLIFVLVSRYSSSGSLIWQKSFGAVDGGSYLWALTLDKADGSVYVAGNTWGSMQGPNAGITDIVVAKLLSSNGDIVWIRQIGTGEAETPSSMALDKSGNVFIVGHTGGGLDGNPHLGGTDIFMIKYDGGGNKLERATQMGTVENDSAEGIAIDNKNNVVIVGSTFGNFFAGNMGRNDLFIMEFGVDKKWMQEMGTSDYDRAHDVTLDKDGNIYVVGATSGDLDADGPGVYAGGKDFYVIKYGIDGSKIWMKQIGTDKDDEAQSVAVDSEGYVYVTGTTSGALGDNANAGGQDIFVAKFKPTGELH